MHRLRIPAQAELLQHFYDALCGLVEVQRLSDPISLQLVCWVKQLLESGMSLSQQLLESLLGRVSGFTGECGLRDRHVPCLLPLLTYVCKCVGVMPEELRRMAAAVSVEGVLYAPRGCATAAGSCGNVVGCGIGNSATPGRGPSSGGGGQACSSSSGSIGGSRENGDTGACQLAGTCARQSSAHGGNAPRVSVGSAAATHAGAAVIHPSRSVATVPTLQVSAAASAAAADLEQAIRSARSGRGQPGSATPAESLMEQSAVGEMQLLHSQPDTAAVDADARLTRCPGPSLPGSSSSSSKRCYGADDLNADIDKQDEPLPDMGADDTGRPLSRRCRHEEGLAAWWDAAAKHCTTGPAAAHAPAAGLLLSSDGSSGGSISGS
jgi:hypothetical protein